MSGGGSLELAQETRKKERRKKEWEMAYFLNIWFWRVQLFWWMILVLLDAQFAGDSDFHT